MAAQSYIGDEGERLSQHLDPGFWQFHASQC